MVHLSTCASPPRVALADAHSTGMYCTVLQYTVLYCVTPVCILRTKHRAYAYSTCPGVCNCCRPLTLLPAEHGAGGASAPAGCRQGLHPRAAGAGVGAGAGRRRGAGEAAGTIRRRCRRCRRCRPQCPAPADGRRYAPTIARLQIPGTKKVDRLEENLAAVGVKLSEDDVRALEAAVPEGAVAGVRYTNMTTRTFI